MSHLLERSLLALALAGLTACGGGADSGGGASSDAGAAPAEEASRTAEETGSAAREMASEAMDDASRAMDEAGDAMADAAEEAEGAMADAAEQAEGAMDDMAAAGAEAAEEAAATMGQAASAAGGEAPTPGVDGCDVSVVVGDSIAFRPESLEVPGSCETVNVTITHTGRLPKAAMGHNWVLVPADAAREIGNAGIGVGLEGDYLPDDDRIVAATAMVGGGETASTSFELAALEEGASYTYLCTFPGHWTVMQGAFTVSGG
jgi:azurin